MEARDCIAAGILACKVLTGRYLGGFDESNHTRQAMNLPNHVAWSLGHLALTMHRVAEKFDGGPLPQGDFGAELAKTAAGRPVMAFSTEDVAFASKPLDEPARYPSLQRCIEIYNAACDRLAAAVRAAPQSKLDELYTWGASEFPLWALAQRMIFHNGMHTGQIADLRRALGLKSIFA